jgi:hypothetical protein
MAALAFLRDLFWGPARDPDDTSEHDGPGFSHQWRGGPEKGEYWVIAPGSRFRWIRYSQYYRRYVEDVEQQSRGMTRAKELAETNAIEHHVALKTRVWEELG